MVVGTGVIWAAFALVLSYLGLAPRFDEAAWGFFQIWIWMATGAAFAAGVPLLYFAIRPVGRALALLDEGAVARHSAFDKSRRRALNLPSRLGITAFLLWFIPLMTLPLAALLLDGGPGAIEVLMSVIGTTGIGLVHGTFVMYYAEYFTRTRIVPRLAPDGELRGLKGVRGQSLLVKIGLLFVTTGLFPTLLFLVMVAGGTASLEASLFLGAGALVIGGGQCLLIASSLERPVKRLLTGMAQARGGDLATKVTVESADQIGQVTEGFNEMLRGLEKAEFIKETFGRYMPAQVMTRILRGKIPLHGERRTATILFCDLRGFTRMCEETEPAELVEFLNHYLDAMVEILVAHGATIDKFVGDAIMALFGIPIEQPDQALRAIRAGLEMSARLDQVNAERAEASVPSVEFGIGIHTGEVIAGNIGSARKMEYTVIGDTVNTASRIEGLTKRFETRMLISSQVYERVSGQVVATAKEPTRVRGKQEAVVVYEVSGLAEAGSSPAVE